MLYSSLIALELLSAVSLFLLECSKAEALSAELWGVGAGCWLPSSEALPAMNE